ncbi:MAG: sensor histidine kinase [Verrucomicrobia bacterium]|nr:sensor histidine kinase [Verrucomicrobiota bacterium]
MNVATSPEPIRTRATDFLATVWPASSPTDSELQRRTKLAVRAAQLAVIVMVSSAVGGTIIADAKALSAGAVAGLVVLTLAYLAWSLYGMRDAVRWVVQEQGAPGGSGWSPAAPQGAGVYFTVQVGLAGLLYAWGDQGRVPTLVWLVLLPPVAHSVILLRRPGVALVTGLILGILAATVVWQHGWRLLPNALLAFSCAVLFTLVFTSLAVSAEKARGQVQRLASELGEANRKLREYAVQAEELAVIRERNRLAREIHDTLGHYLTVTYVQLEAARAVRDVDPERARQALDKAQALTQEGLQEIRRSVAALRASPLDNKSLAEALRQAGQEQQTSGQAVDVQVLGQPRALSPQAELTLYRAGQEGLTNARKHARARSVHLSLDFRHSARVGLEVSDDGVGVAGEGNPQGGFGLLGLRERALLLGGEVRVKTSPGAGFKLEVEVPG